MRGRFAHGAAVLPSGPTPQTVPCPGLSTRVLGLSGSCVPCSDPLGLLTCERDWSRDLRSHLPAPPLIPRGPPGARNRTRACGRGCPATPIERAPPLPTAEVHVRPAKPCRLSAAITGCSETPPRRGKPGRGVVLRRLFQIEQGPVRSSPIQSTFLAPWISTGAVSPPPKSERAGPCGTR